MYPAIDLQETSSLPYTFLCTLKSPIERIGNKLNRNNSPRVEFDTSLTRLNPVIDNSTTVGLANADVMDELKGVYEFSNIDEIRNFIMENEYLVDILNEAPQNIYRIFGNNVKLILECHSDPEEAWEELFIVIKSSRSPKEAFELEKKLFDEWFLNIMDKVNNKLNFIEEPESHYEF
ncbi:MAG: hypothetical protein QW735_04045 [archaeon]